MFEFCRDAESEYEEIFFNKIRFFLVIISIEDLVIRIYRIIRKFANGSDQGFIILEFLLRFEYREFCSISRNKFKRKTVFEIFGKILLGYRAKELHMLLHNAAKAIVEKLRKDTNGMYLRGDENFYRHRQTVIPPSKRTTPAAN
jgi:hypothetical protein